MNQTHIQALNLTAPADATEYALRGKARQVLRDNRLSRAQRVARLAALDAELAQHRQAQKRAKIEVGQTGELGLKSQVAEVPATASAARRVVKDINGRLRVVKADVVANVPEIQALQQRLGAAANQSLIRIAQCG